MGFVPTTTVDRSMRSTNIDFTDTTANRFGAMLVMSNTTVDTEEDELTLADYTTLDECDGANYARIALTNVAVTKENANDRAIWTSDNLIFPNLGAGTRQNVGLLIFQAPTADITATADAVNVPVAFIDGTSGGSPVTFPFDGSGVAVTFTTPAEGWLRAAAA